MIKVIEKSTAPTISKYIYGQFAEHLGRGIYEGIFVGKDSVIPNQNGMRKDVVAALKQINIPVLRWPGGCFADEYHWKDGIGELEERKKMINTHWGGIVEDNSFGTHEFFELIKQLGCEAYVNGNVGSGTVKEMSEWIEYITMPADSTMANLRKQHGHTSPWNLSFFGVGNENWGCGGNMRAEYYSDLYRQYQTYVRNYTDKNIYKIAGGANIDDYHWTETLMKNAHWLMNGLSLHYYVHPLGWEEKGSATVFDENEWYITCEKALYMDELITKHSTIMDTYDPQKRIGLIVDEWGTWFSPEPGTNPGFLYQQNTLRDAMVAAITLDIFHQHADRVYMANIAQAVNVLQAMILTEGPAMIKTPTYHVFDLYQVHQDAKKIDTFGLNETHITHTLSKKKDIFNLSICNYDIKQDKTLTFTFETDIHSVFNNQILTAEHMNAYNDFDHPETVNLSLFNEFTTEGTKLTIHVPAKSILTLQLRTL